jgi:hypothetical protein
MFVKAYEIAAAFTHPVIVSVRFFDDTVQCSLASFIVLNDEGWVITAAHVIEPASVYRQHQQKIAAHALHVRTIEEGPGTSTGKAKRIRSIPTSKRWLKNYSLWWGWDGGSVAEFQVLPEADLVLGKLEGFEPSVVHEYPVFRVSPPMAPGRNLCKLGFPFHDIEATFDPRTETFQLPPGTLPVPRFPLDGIMTRNVREASVGTGRSQSSSSRPRRRACAGTVAGPSSTSAGASGRCRYEPNTSHWASARQSDRAIGSSRSINS